MSQHFHTALLLLCSVTGGKKAKARGHMVSEQLLQHIQTDITEQAHSVPRQVKKALFVHKSTGKWGAANQDRVNSFTPSQETWHRSLNAMNRNATTPTARTV